MVIVHTMYGLRADLVNIPLVNDAVATSFRSGRADHQQGVRLSLFSEVMGGREQSSPRSVAYQQLR